MRKSKENRKNKIIKKDIQKGTTIIEFNLSKAVLMLIMIGTVLAGLLTKEIVTTIVDGNKTELLSNEDINNVQNGTGLQTERIINGDLGYISSVDSKEIKTGTGPFDENDEPGNDSSENNYIVRSFDQITWTYQLNFALKEPDSGTSLTGGVIKITAELPGELANVVEWDTESMKWLSNANLSKDGINLSGEYSMSEEEVTIPGNQDVIFVLKVKNAVNGTKIQPTFTFMLDGNEEKEKKEIKAQNEITVSATGKYNIQLYRNTELEDKTTIDYGEGEVTGRMYGYAFTIQLYNNTYSETENPYSKGIKGLEYPKGEISFDIELKLERTEQGSEIVEDITKEITPVLWNYRENIKSSSDLTGNIDGRKMHMVMGNDYVTYYLQLPEGVNNGDRSCSVYNSGDIEINQEGSILHVKINNYEFDKTYPQYHEDYEKNSNRIKIFQDNVGTFSIGYMQIFVPEPTKIPSELTNYYLTVEDKNLSVITSSNEEITEQEVQSDDFIRNQYIISKTGNINSFMDSGDFENRGRDGDNPSFRNQIITFELTISQSGGIDSEYYLCDEDYIYKFDGEGLEPAYDKITFNVNNGENLNYNTYYLTKLDGTNWTNQEEMNNTIDISEFNIYKTKEEIPNGYIVVGILFESQEGGRLLPVYSDIEVRMKIKETAEIGKTYGMTFAVRGWVEENKLDRSIYTVEKQETYKDYPEPYFIKAGQEYVKTEYDENGQIIAGTNKNGYYAGNTVLVVGGDLSGSIKAVDSNKVEKVNYDLGKNEDTITYNVQPILNVKETNLELIKDVTLKAQVILPKGLSYELGSSRRGEEEYTEPEITENADGTTILVWYINGVASGQEIEPIEFGTKISKSSDHGIQYTTTFIISEYVGENGITKIGNGKISDRTSTTAINIINLASFRLYKEAITQIIEKEGKIQYRITGINTTDVVLPDFVLLDIMPYNKKENSSTGEIENGDGRETEFRGTYIIEKIVITQNMEEKARDNSNLKVYYTQDEQVKTASAKDNNIGEVGIWTEVQETNNVTNNLDVNNITQNTSTTENSANIITTKSYNLNVEQANDGVTGIAIKGELAGQTEIIVDIYIKTNGNQVEDKYVNSATAQTQTITEVVQTSQEKAQVIGRAISGKVWLDENYNNIIDNNEGLGNLNKDEITLKLYKVDENNNLQEVINVDGVKVEGVHPDETGYYEFIHLPAEDYIVKIEYNGDEYTLVEKNVGSNTEINSKFEIETSSNTGESPEGGQNSNIITAKTDTITKLNDTSNYMIKEQNINAGLTKKINFEFTKVAEEDHTNKIGGTEFQLYKLKCTNHEEGYHDQEQIDIKNVDANCWELADTQSSKTGILNDEETGKVIFNNLQIGQEYRLIETKTSLNRISPKGQWKIQLVKTENEEIPLIKIDEYIGIEITAVGNPPAFVTDNGEILLPNRAYFEFPTSGSLGIKNLFQIGMVIIAIDIIIILIKKFIVIDRKVYSKGKHNKKKNTIKEKKE